MGLPEEYMEQFIENVSVYEKTQAFNHLLRTSCSLESLVVGAVSYTHLDVYKRQPNTNKKLKEYFNMCFIF